MSPRHAERRRWRFYPAADRNHPIDVEWKSDLHADGPGLIKYSATDEQGYYIETPFYVDSRERAELLAHILHEDLGIATEDQTVLQDGRTWIVVAGGILANAPRRRVARILDYLRPNHFKPPRGTRLTAHQQRYRAAERSWIQQLADMPRTALLEHLDADRSLKRETTQILRYLERDEPWKNLTKMPALAHRANDIALRATFPYPNPGRTLDGPMIPWHGAPARIQTAPHQEQVVQVLLSPKGRSTQSKATKGSSQEPTS